MIKLDESEERELKKFINQTILEALGLLSVSYLIIFFVVYFM